MKLSELIKMYRAERHLSARAFAKQTGFSNAYISLLENDKVPSPSLEALNSIALAMGMSLDSMLRQVDDMNVRLSEEKSRNDLSGIKGILPIPESRQVPMLGAIACGEPIYMDEERGEYYPLDTKIHADFCLRAEGDSMTGARICDGDIVFIQAVPEVENGSIAAVAIDDEATLKYFFQYGDTVVLRPANPKYQEMTYSQDDLNRVRVLGRAVAFQSGL
ncbi:helix-turn-helix domain-containing protein [Dubosiella newyorkensis]|uniref:helix-turn-helix domain-containing protein n=1 Tax=Dubosiella newyorkensis TaxID=1862672 RepID=UPI00272CB39E|nr:XRE family transcriptional regulator [Dubosiella newyorkensis]